jgi:7-keto-8-aminopelargonate synthetase-like enzyme
MGMTFYTQQVPGRIIQVAGKDYLYFGGTSYLGLQTDKEFSALMLDCIKNYGSSHGASRISNLRLNIYEQAETQIAAWAGSEAALTLSSGFLAGQLLAYVFEHPSYKSFYTHGMHAAVIRNPMQLFSTPDELEAAIKKEVSDTKGKIPVLFMESVDLAGSSYPSFEFLKRLPLDKIIIVADDSHGMGILGDNGGGLYKILLSFNPRELLVCCSLGKALGVQGGAIIGQVARIRELWGTPFFSGASPAPPGHMAALISASVALYHDKRKQLQRNIGLFEALVPETIRFRRLPHYPVFGFNHPDLTSHLATLGILVTDFPYPASQADTFHGRIVLSAHHQEQDILRLAEALGGFSGMAAQ